MQRSEEVLEGTEDSTRAHALGAERRHRAASTVEVRHAPLGRARGGLRAGRAAPAPPLPTPHLQSVRIPPGTMACLWLHLRQWGQTEACAHE